MVSITFFFLNNPLKMYKPFLACGLYKNRPPAVVGRPPTPALQLRWRASDALLLPQMLVAQVQSRDEKANQAPPGSHPPLQGEGIPPASWMWLLPTPLASPPNLHLLPFVLGPAPRDARRTTNQGLRQRSRFVFKKSTRNIQKVN